MFEALNEYVSEATLKSLNNRVKSALAKEGTPAQLLRSASQSLNAFAESLKDESEALFARVISEALGAGADIAKAGKEATKATKEPREQWHEADSPEGKKILAKATQKAKKPARTKSAEVLEALDLEQAQAVLAAILNAGR